MNIYNCQRDYQSTCSRKFKYSWRLNNVIHVMYRGSTQVHWVCYIMGLYGHWVYVSRFGTIFKYDSATDIVWQMRYMDIGLSYRWTIYVYTRYEGIMEFLLRICISHIMHWTSIYRSFWYVLDETLVTNQKEILRKLRMEECYDCY